MSEASSEVMVGRKLDSRRSLSSLSFLILSLMLRLEKERARRAVRNIYFNYVLLFDLLVTSRIECLVEFGLSDKILIDELIGLVVLRVQCSGGECKQNPSLHDLAVAELQVASFEIVRVLGSVDRMSKEYV